MSVERLGNCMSQALTHNVRTSTEMSSDRNRSLGRHLKQVKILLAGTLTFHKLCTCVNIVKVLNEGVVVVCQHLMIKLEFLLRM